MIERPAVHPQLLEIAPRLADLRSRRDPEDRHDLVAVDVGAHPRQVFLLGQFRDAPLEVVVVGLQPRRAALVAGRAVRAHQLVQPAQQRPGVGDVAPHRRVRPPAVAVAVEPQVQIHQLRDVGDHLLRVLQLTHPLARHLRPDHLVVMEAHPAVRFVPAGRGLADVVQQCRPAQHQVGAVLFEVDRLPQHRQRVLIDVLVLVVLVDRHPHRTDLGQHHVPEAGLDHQIQPRHRVLPEQQFVQLRGDPFGGDARQLRGHLLQRGTHPRRDGEPELRDEPRRAQHPQRVVTERHLRRGGGVEHPVAQRGQPVERVQEFGRPVGGDPHGHRVHGEVAAHQIVGQVVAEPDLRIA